MPDRSSADRGLAAPTVDARIASLLLLASAVAIGAAIVLGVLWWRASHREISVGELSPEDRQRLVERLITNSPGVHQWSWFEPPIGYTLRPDATLEAWNDTFTSNEIGFRAPPLEKAEGTFRVVFVGDSWTYGMGVAGDQAYPRVFAELADTYAGSDRPIEAWTLALPGWNSFNQVAAFWFFFHQLEPDLVVIAPSSNDNHGSASVLPNGSPYRRVPWRDDLGDPHVVTYRLPVVDSFRYWQRWQQSLLPIGDTIERLEALDIPVYVFFLSRWVDELAHHLVQLGGLEAPYLSMPFRYTMDAWENDDDVGHGTPFANALYARVLYRALAPELGWQALPAQVTDGLADPETGAPLEDPVVPLYHPPVEGEWRDAVRETVARVLRRLPHDFEPAMDRQHQLAGPLNPRSGTMGRATTVLVRRPDGVDRVRIEVRALPGLPGLYPLTLRVHVPSAGGGRRAELTVDGDPRRAQVLEVPLPEDIEVGSAVDVVLEVDRVASAPKVLVGHALRVSSIRLLEARTTR